MKKLRKLMVITLSALFVFTACFSLVACDNTTGDEKPEVKITLDFDSTKGSVTLDKQSYKAGDRVNVTISSLDGYEIKSVSVGDNSMTEELRNGSSEFAETTFSFIASIDRTVKVEYQEHGVWSNSDYVWEFTISDYNTRRGSVVFSPNRARYARGEEITVTINTTDGSVIKTFSINGVDQKENIYNGVFTFNISEDTNLNVVLDADCTVITNTFVSTFDNDINREGKVLLDFWGDQCGYCVQYLAPQLEQYVTNLRNGSAAEVALDIKIVKVRVTSHYDVNIVQYRTPEYQILTREMFSQYFQGGLPYVVMIENGRVIGTVNGAYNNYSQLLEWMQNPQIK